MSHTPKGYRIELAHGHKYLVRSEGGEDTWKEATACEMELWAIREELLKALKDLPLIAKAALKDNSPFAMMQALSRMLVSAEAAIKSAERANVADELPPEFRDGTLKTKKETKWRAWRTDREDGISGTGETETEAIMALAEQYRQIEEDME